ncbi:hypothetical protein [Micromonospora sp. NBS 11-29]|uniref:hypothetical protein n=1 Tax=Micromonospora sp. NBS 11-29 TaxID=1960879 RepID=UPI0020CF441D|nr:hypothetical protein [Micromonospora sp. NBS 11-29]
MTYGGSRLLCPLGLVERLIAALRGGHDLDAQLLAQLRQLLAQLFRRGVGGAALGPQRDGKADQHHGQDRQHRTEPERAVAVRHQQNQRRQGRQPDPAPEQDGQRRRGALVGGSDRGWHG